MNGELYVTVNGHCRIDSEVFVTVGGVVNAMVFSAPEPEVQLTDHESHTIPASAVQAAQSHGRRTRHRANGGAHGEQWVSGPYYWQ
ncbi:hypothetical protein chiPu_0019551 [Chiloscyllium punctatum]|uniref:Uncharacterized protein n=1 Tax=Chiloscyllium punctatum TaxID=137246 RepID=A0A401RSG3_CHIPU|nr:hypothetical protein [Chiloscyllium punctatum]